MVPAFVPIRAFIGPTSLRLSRNASRLSSAVPRRATIQANQTARERRRAAGIARERQHRSLKKHLDENADNLIAIHVVIPSHVRQRCSLTTKLARVKVFVERTDVTDVSMFRDRVRSRLVSLYPELDERGLLRASDGFDMRIAGNIIADDVSIFQSSLASFETMGTPIYVEITPHNMPHPKPPFSPRVKEVEEKARTATKDDNLQLCMISFYKFVQIDDAALTASLLTRAWARMGVKGRVYVAPEGVNAQIAVPQPLLKDFKDAMSGAWVERGEPIIPREVLGVFLNEDRIVHHTEQPFSKLSVRPRDKVLADGLDNPLDWTAAGREISADDWHRTLKGKPDDVVLLDCRNNYESDVGHFEGAEALNTSTFRETWDRLEKRLSGTDRETPILTYCTGGIRCVKVNAFLQQKMGFTNTGRLAGGIVSYAHTLRERGELGESLFKGVNHVFDGRMGEVITGDLLHHCLNCGQPSNVQTDCANEGCPRPFNTRIFVQCAECTARMLGACCNTCRNAVAEEMGPPHTIQGRLGDRSGTRDMDTGFDTSLWAQTESEKYADSYSVPEDELLTQARLAAYEHFPRRAIMLTSYAQLLFLKMVAQMTGARRALEIGTFTGYGALGLASAMPGGEVVTCELDNATADIAESLFKKQPSEWAKVTLLRGRAIEQISKVAQNDDVQPFDLVYIDADKGSYLDYVTLLLDEELLRVGGYLVSDNVLFRGEVAAVWKEETGVIPDNKDNLKRKRLSNAQNLRRTARILHKFNEYIYEEDRLEQVILPMRDGLSFARRIK